MTTQTHHTIPAMVPPANCFTILAVDDALANRVLLRKILLSSGYAAIEACDGVEALTLLQNGSLPDLIITDIEMPSMDGISFVRELRSLDGPLARIPVIAASGNADEAMRREALAAGCDAFMTKPFDLSVLRHEIADLLTQRRPVSKRSVKDRSANTPSNRIKIDLRQAS